MQHLETAPAGLLESSSCCPQRHSQRGLVDALLRGTMEVRRAGFCYHTFGSGDLLEATEGSRSAPVATELPTAAAAASCDPPRSFVLVCRAAETVRSCPIIIVIMRPQQPCCSRWVVPVIAELTAQQLRGSSMQRLSVLNDTTKMKSGALIHIRKSLPEPVWMTSCRDR